MAELHILGAVGSYKNPTMAIGTGLRAVSSAGMEYLNAAGIFDGSGRCCSSGRLVVGARFLDFDFSRRCCAKVQKMTSDGVQLGRNFVMNPVQVGESSMHPGRWSLIKGFGVSAAILIGLDLLEGEAAMAGLTSTVFPWQKAPEKVEEQVEPSRGTCATCIGVVDETLGTCNATANCVSSFDDRPGFFVAPWEFPGKLPAAVQDLKGVLRKAGANIEEQGERYVHAIFKSEDGIVDDVEFLFSNPKEDAVVVLRSASRATRSEDKKRNMNRLEDIRKALTWEQVPVLRNRKRAFFFLKSPCDSFGPEPPPSYDYKKGNLQLGSD